MNIAMLLNPKCDIAYLENDDSIRQGLEKFKKYGYTAIPVISKDGSYYGIIRDKDFLLHLLKNNNFCIQEYEDDRIKSLIQYGKNPPVNINASLEELMTRICDWNFVPVVDSRNLFVGIITRKTVITYLNKYVIKHKIRI